jgi:hypothetical protein
MYVNPFWMGVFTLLIVEVGACIVYAIIESSKGGK